MQSDIKKLVEMYNSLTPASKKEILKISEYIKIGENNLLLDLKNKDTQNYEQAGSAK